MTAGGRHFAKTSAVLIFLAALSLFFAPVPTVEAMQCHEHSSLDRSGIGHAVAVAAELHAPQGSFHTLHHKACCAAQCSFCIFAANIERTEARASKGSVLAFEWRDKTGHGLVPPPTLGPPRLPV